MATVDSGTFTGEWWDPSRPDRRVAGTMTWDEIKGGRLELVGLLVAESDDPRLPSGVRFGDRLREDAFPEVHGLVGGKEFTLLDVHQIGRTTSHPSGQVTDRLSFLHYLTGNSHLTDVAAGGFVDLSIGLKHLATWVQRTGLGSLSDSEGRGIRVTDLDPIEFPIPSGKAKLWHYAQQQFDRYHALGYEEDWRVEFAGDAPASVEWYLDLASDFQDLLSLAVRDTAEFHSVAVTHKDIYIKTFDGPHKEVHSPLNYFAPWSQRSQLDEDRQWWDLLFTFDEFGGADGVAKWMASAPRYRGEISRLMCTWYNPHMYLEDRLFNVCAAIDGLDKVRREITGTAPYIGQVKETISYVGAPFDGLVTGDKDAWAEQVKTARHELGHRRLVHDDGHRERWILWQQVFWLGMFAILKEASATDDLLRKIASHKAVSWLAADAASLPGSVESRSEG